MAALLEHKDTLLQEVHHRIGNSLQIISSMLALDARKVHSAEARLYLEKAQQRILAVSTVHQQLQTLREAGDVEIASYLHQLCDNLTESLGAGSTRIGIDVLADAGTVSSTLAVNVGLIVTELVINALKHAFTSDTVIPKIVVTYRLEGHGWRLTVSDNGGGKPHNAPPAPSGLGTSILASLVRQLDAQVETSRGLNGLGTSVSITHRLASRTQ